MKYLITDPTTPDRELTLDLDETEFYNDGEPEVNNEQVTELLDWWSDPVGRGYLQLDGGQVVVVDASSGEPTIEPWFETDDDRYLLEDFPFGLGYLEVTA